MTASATVTIQVARASSCSDPSKMPNVNPTPGTMLVGGGGIPPEAIDWLRDHGQNGNLVVLSGSGGAFAGVYASESAAGVWQCVTSLVINSTAIAENLDVEKTIAGATAIFIEGGDQTIYWTTWSNTKVQTALRAKVGSIPIGGSSAGMHLLGGVIYTPPLTGDGISSSEALADPNSPLMGFQGPFVSITN